MEVCEAADTSTIPLLAVSATCFPSTLDAFDMSLSFHICIRGAKGPYTPGSHESSSHFLVAAEEGGVQDVFSPSIAVMRANGSTSQLSHMMGSKCNSTGA